MWFDAAVNIASCSALLLLVWAPLGRGLLRAANEDSEEVDVGTAVAFGMGVWGFWILLLGLLGLLYRSVALGSIAAIVLFLVLRRWPGPVAATGLSRCFSPGVVRATALALGCVSALYIGIALASALAPELAFDSLNVHLPYARDAARLHRAGFVPNNWSSAMPALPLMTYITGFLFDGVALVKLFNVAVYLATGVVLFSAARRWWTPLHGIAAAALFWSCPVAIYEATTALIDLPLALYSAVFVVALVDWTRAGRGIPIVSAIALGLALGCKYHAAFWIAPALVVVWWHLVVHRSERSSRAAAACLRYGAAAFVLLLPWVVRAWCYTGNPVFPAANGFFGSPYFPPSMQRAAAAAYANEGVGHGFVALLALPWTVTFHPGPFRGTLGVVFLVGAVLALARRKPPEIRYVLFLSAAYFYSWALTAQEIRYLLPLVPLLALVTAAGFLGTAAEPQPRPARVAAGLALTAAAVMALPPIYPLWARQWTYWHAYRPALPYLLGRETREEYLGRDVPSIHVYDFANHNLTSDDRILLLNDASQFYSDVPTLYSFTVEAERILAEASEEALIRRMRESRVTHVLLNYNGIAPIPGVAPRLGVYFFLDRSFQQRCMNPVYSRNNVTLYRFQCQ